LSGLDRGKVYSEGGKPSKQEGGPVTIEGRKARSAISEMATCGVRNPAGGRERHVNNETDGTLMPKKLGEVSLMESAGRKGAGKQTAAGSTNEKAPSSCSLQEG